MFLFSSYYIEILAISHLKRTILKFVSNVKIVIFFSNSEEINRRIFFIIHIEFNFSFNIYAHKRMHVYDHSTRSMVATTFSIFVMKPIFFRVGPVLVWSQLREHRNSHVCTAKHTYIVRVKRKFTLPLLSRSFWR